MTEENQPSLEAVIAADVAAEVKKDEPALVATEPVAAVAPALPRPERPSVSIDQLPVLDYIDAMLRWRAAGGVF